MMDESQTLSQISAAFEPYLKTPDEIYHIRTQIAKYIQSLEPQRDPEIDDLKRFSIPSHVTGIRRQYLTALHINNTARKEYEHLREEINDRPTPLDDTDHLAETASTHLDLLRLRKQGQEFQILSRYAAEAESLAERNHVYGDQLSTELKIPEAIDSENTDQSLLLAQQRALMRNLEVAVLQASHRLKREKHLLEKIKSYQAVSDNPSSQSKLYAIDATNRELTRWIEESLARCDMANGDQDPHPSNVPQQNHEPPNYGQKINDQYELYMIARTRLLNAASNLTGQLPASMSTEALSIHERPQTLSQQTKSSQDPPTTSIIPYISSHYLPLQDQNQTLNQSKDHLNSILARHTQDLSEQLLRLSDESHLLPAYPILAKKKSQAETSEVERLLHAWKFAMDAAEIATESTVDRQIKIGEKVMDEANAVIDELNESQAIWEQVDEA